MKKLLFALIFLPYTGYSQTSVIDSLKRSLQTIGGLPEGYAKDTAYCSALKAVIRAYVDIDIDSASHYNMHLIQMSERQGLQKDLIYAYQYAGYLYQVRGDYHQSIRYHFKALPLAEKLKQYTRMAASYGWLAHAYTSLGEFNRAIRFCELGLTTLKLHPDSYVQCSILNVQGAVLRQQGKLDQALKVNRQLYDLARKDNHAWYEAQGLHAIGWVYKEMNNIPLGLIYFRDALVLAQKMGVVDLQGSILLNMSDLYSKQKDWENALQYCNMAKIAAVKVKNSSIEAEAFENFYKIYKQIDQPANALNAYEKFITLKDSLSKEKTDHRIETLQAQYDNVQKTNDLNNKETELLAHRRTRNELLAGIIFILVIAGMLFLNNTRLQAKNKQIDGQKKLIEIAREELSNINKTLESRVEERTHELLHANQELIRKNEDIKNALYKGQAIERKRVAIELHDNLSSLLSAVNMSIQHINFEHLSKTEQTSYQTIKHLVKNAYAEVRNISHNILPADLEKKGLVTTLATFVANLNQSSPIQFSLMIYGLDQRLPIEIEFNAYSIVLELINNAIKHASASSVVISLKRTDCEIELAVTDDGIGLIDSNAKRGVGLQNIQARLEHLGGAFTSSQQEERGTRFEIKIPVETKFFTGNLPSV
ncbi:hypothetical protein GCM10010967_12990 [Dyadobacter beijingensis]|uniref:Oxygen sensor histidine kinase NreB n=1 Tax=Dyadobacter beijingensis TaxID=365489 RepID=A0ABQ2HIQ3_9BACT|nr:ATP-binding protein [Dyadobacter beijingensis]GGM82724.1 hypothetical protein GCM10010967_12990 [Dyadobacter beijingensis]